MSRIDVTSKYGLIYQSPGVHLVTRDGRAIGYVQYIKKEWRFFQMNGEYLTPRAMRSIAYLIDEAQKGKR